MKSFGAFGTAVVLLLLSSVAPMPAQQSQDPKSPRRETKDKDEQRHAKPGQPTLQAREPEPERRRVEPQEQQEIWHQRRAHAWATEHQGWKQRGGYRGFRIPEARFRGHFGRDHWFRIYRVPMVLVGGHPRFQYGDYWFRLMDPWPEDWSNEWYRNDDVSIDYTNDGYYLFNRNHPGNRLALRVYPE